MLLPSFFENKKPRAKWCNLFRYKDRSIVFVICALIVIFERERLSRAGLVFFSALFTFYAVISIGNWGDTFSIVSMLFRKKRVRQAAGDNI